MSRDDILRTLGKNMVEAREKLNLKRADLIRLVAREINTQKNEISVETLRNWERGRNQPPVDYLLAISRVLNVSLDYLFTGQEYDSDTQMAYIKSVYSDADLKAKSLFIEFTKIIESIK